MPDRSSRNSGSGMSADQQASIIRSMPRPHALNHPGPEKDIGDVRIEGLRRMFVPQFIYGPALGSTPGFHNRTLSGYTLI